MLTEVELADRLTGIGGSEIAAILGLSRFSSPFDVWLAKTQGWRKPVTEDMLRGSYLEDGIARWYAATVGATLIEPGAMRHPDVPIARCTPDRIASIEGQGNHLLSIKCPRRGGPHWGKPWSDEFPAEYNLQLQWEHLVATRAAGCGLGATLRLAALLDGDLVVYESRADPELQLELLSFARDWWARHIVGGEQPDLNGSSQFAEWVKFRSPAEKVPVRDAGSEEVRILRELRIAQEEKEAAFRVYETFANMIRLRIGDSGGLHSDIGEVTWRTDSRGRRILRTNWKPKEDTK